MAPALTREQVLDRLASFRMDRVETLLLTAVNREARIDINLGKDLVRQERLRTSMRGLSILYYFSFLQSHISEQEWGGIKAPNGPNRAKFNKVNWHWFDALKYVRDCFGHDWEGSLFPATQGNTQHFQAIMAGTNPPPGVTVTKDRIELTDDNAVFQCLQVVRSVLDKAELRP